MDQKRSEIVTLTGLLRSSQDPFWTRLRLLLHDRDLEPKTVLLAESFPDDARFEFGILVTDRREVFQFGFDYLHKPIEEGTLTEWTNLTEYFLATPYRQSIQTALEMIAEGAAT